MRRLGIAHMLSGRAAALTDELRHRYDPTAAAALGAHLTIAGPAETAACLDELTALLSRVAAEWKPFDLTIAGVATFLPVTPTCHLGVEPRERLKSLHDSMVRTLGWTDAFDYVPHVTITEYLHEDLTAQVAEEVEALGIREQHRLSAFTLLEKSAAGRWVPIRTFPLGERAD
jgi:2'-5' RNA ligase